MQNIKHIFRHIYDWVLHHKVITGIFVFAGFIHIGIIFFSGSIICQKNACGMYIGGLHFHDSLWHLALANSAFNKLPFQLPVYVGASLQGYNYFIDLIIYLLTKIGISALISYFKLIPVIFFLSFSYLSYLYAKKTNKSQIFIACFLFFIFFGSSFTYILSLYHFKTLSSFYYAQAMQSGRMLLNLQYAVSLLPFLGSLVILKNKNLSLLHIFTLGFLLIVTTGFKLYGGVILLFLLGTDLIIRFVKEKKYIYLIKSGVIILASFILAVILFYNPFVAMKSGAVFIFSPFALSRQMIEAADHFYMPQLVQARYYLQSVNPHSPRLFAIELFSAFLFIFLNSGTRIVGFIYITAQILRKKITKDEMVLFLSIIFSTLLTLTLVQKGTWWNVVQFYGYSLFLMNYFAAMFLYKLFSSKKLFLACLGIVIILLTLPTNIEQMSFPFERSISITSNELKALEKLKQLPEGTVQSLPLQDTAYISAFSGKKQYIADEGVLTIIGIDFRGRMASIKNINSINLIPQIQYLYIKKIDYKESQQIIGFTTVYENSEIVIKKRN